MNARLQKSAGCRRLATTLNLYQVRANNTTKLITLEKVGDKKDEKELWDVPPGYSAAINFCIFPWSWKEKKRESKASKKMKLNSQLISLSLTDN